MAAGSDTPHPEAVWRRLAPTGAFIVTLLGGFLVPPPIGSEQSPFFGLAKFVTTVLGGLTLVATWRWHSRRHWRRWVSATIVLVCLGITEFFVYRYFVQTWTCSYFGVPIVVGTELTDQGHIYTKEHGTVPCDTMLEDFLGNAELIWRRDDIIARRLKLAAVYLSCVLFFAGSVMALAQAVRLTQNPASYRHGLPRNFRQQLRNGGR